LEQTIKTLQPWEGANLKFVQGNDLPKPHICVAYIPDDEPGKRLEAEEVLHRLMVMNHGLNTQEWVVLHRDDSGPGQTWTFSVDELSMTLLRKLEFRPYFGFGQVILRPRVRGGKEPPRNTPEVAVAGGSGSTPLPVQTKGGKNVPRRPGASVSEGGPKPLGHKKGKDKTIPGRPKFKKKSGPRPKEDKNPRPPKEGGDKPPSGEQQQA
jgi:hypothetical protein